MVLRVGDIPSVIKYYFVKHKGENCRKLHCRIKMNLQGFPNRQFKIGSILTKNIARHILYLRTKLR